MIKKTLILYVLFITAIFACRLGAVNIAINVNQERAAISPHIYGANIAGDPEDPTQYQLADAVNWASRRQGGNRFTGYNWEINASNAGADYGPNSSDPYLCLAYGVTACDTPGEVLTRFHNQCLARGQSDLVTLQMAGFAAGDKIWNNGDPGTAIADLTSDRWKTVVYKKTGAFTTNPNTTDEYVYMDEYVNWMVNKFGASTTANGIKMISLDNEPTLWATTHPRIHPTPVTYAELKNKSIQLATAIKDVDPNVLIFGSAEFGWSGFQNLNNATDRATEGAGYAWFIDYYLDKFEAASVSYGRRLLDVLDIHWYPEDNGNSCRIVYTDYDSDCPNKTDPSVNSDARMQAPRTLWDSTYNQTSWIPNPVRLIPRLQSSIDTYYPGTKIAITEYDFGGGTHYSAGIAQADALGVFGKYGVFAAYYWDITPGPYTIAGVKLFRNYDGAKHTYGDTKVKADTDDVASMPVYASQFNGDDSKLHIIVINRSSSAKPANISITGPYAFDSGNVWGFDSTSYTITARAAIPSITGNAFTYNVPAYTALHMVLNSSLITPTYTHTVNPLFTHTFTPTPTNTPEPGFMFDDFEDLNAKNNLNGDNYKYSGASSNNFATQFLSPGAASSGNYIRITGTVADYGGFGMNFAASGAADLSAYQGIEFYIKGTGTYWMQFTQDSIADYDYHGTLVTATGTWTKVTVMFSAIAQKNGTTPVAFTQNALNAVQWASNGNGTFDLALDEIKLLPAASSTSTPTHTNTRTYTYTATGTATYTSTFTRTPTSTNTAVNTSTNTMIPSATFTNTSTNTPVNTPTNTYTSTATASHTGTDTFTVTYTPSETVTTGGPTFTFTHTFTQTHTNTNTATATQTQTFTYTSTAQPNTATYTYSPTNVPSLPSTSTNTPSATLPASTATNTSVFTATQTPVNTHTQTAVPPSATHTRTSTGTATSTHTYTFTNTLTHTPTYTATTVPSFTYTPTPTATPIPADSKVQEIKDIILFPHPYNSVSDSLKIKYTTTKRSSEITMKIYSSAFRLIKKVSLGKNVYAGTHVGEVKVSQIKQLANGTYYFVIEDKDGARSRTDKIIILK